MGILKLEMMYQCSHIIIIWITTIRPWLCLKLKVHIGDPKGKFSIGNPQGYSLFQHKQFNSLQHPEIDNIRNSNIMGANLPMHNINNNSNSNNNGNFETWNDVSMQPYDNDNTSMIMFEAESSNASSGNWKST